MIFIAISYHSRKRKTGTGGEVPKIFFETTPFRAKKTPFLKREGLQKGHIRSRVEKGRNLDLERPIVSLYKPTAFQKHFSHTKVSTSLRDTWGLGACPLEGVLKITL